MQGFELIYEGPDSPNGKTWRVTPLADNSGLLVEYGAAGSRLRSLRVPIEKCEKGSLSEEMARRVQDKTDKGYVIVNDALEFVLDPVGVSEDSGSDNPVLAHASFSRDMDDPRDAVAAHLETVLRSACHPGTYSIKKERSKCIVTGHFRGGSSPETLSVPTVMGQSIRADDRTLCLTLASLAMAMPSHVRLAADNGNEMRPRELAALFETDESVLEAFGIVRAVEMDQSHSLGAWFF